MNRSYAWCPSDCIIFLYAQNCLHKSVTSKNKNTKQSHCSCDNGNAKAIRQITRKGDDSCTVTEIKHPISLHKEAAEQFQHKRKNTTQLFDLN